jgi:hypothetical protein
LNIISQSNKMSSTVEQYEFLIVPRRGCIVREVVLSTDKDALSALEWLYCPRCGGHHYDGFDENPDDPSGLAACDEYRLLVEHFNDEDDSWWLENRKAEAHWHDATPCWSTCQASHSHPCTGGCVACWHCSQTHSQPCTSGCKSTTEVEHEEPCFDSGCRRCPVCAGRMEEGEWFGQACSRSCFRSV